MLQEGLVGMGDPIHVRTVRKFLGGAPAAGGRPTGRVGGQADQPGPTRTPSPAVAVVAWWAVSDPG